MRPDLLTFPGSSVGRAGGCAQSAASTGNRRVKNGVNSGKPESQRYVGYGNPEPSSPSQVSFEGEKVQRLEGEASCANKPSSSAPHLRCDSESCYGEEIVQALEKS